jgi:hypothetical protein
LLVIILVSLVTPRPSRKSQELVEHVRYPNLKPLLRRAGGRPLPPTATR